MHHTPLIPAHSPPRSRSGFALAKRGAGIQHPLIKLDARLRGPERKRTSPFYCALARTFGNRGIEPVGSLSGFIGVPAGAFGGSGDDPGPDVSGAVFPG